MAGKYDKVELIGSGTFGKAWLVLKADTGRKYVLKEIQVLGMSDKTKKQALTEVRALSRCRHVNVIRYKEAFVDVGVLCIIMEFADGGDLHQQIQTRKGKYFDNEVISDWFVQICFALQMIHSLSIIHRDLKTQNIFVTNSGIIKVGDLGIARILKMDEEHAYTAIGTPYCLSPEICERKPYDYKTDMWAAGCVLYELCTFKHPFDGPSLSSLVLKITQGKYKPIPKSCGPILEDLVSVLLKIDPEQRPSAKQILRVPSLQLYVQHYVTKTKTLRAKQVLASPCISGPDVMVTPEKPEVAESSPDTKMRVSGMPERRKRSLSTPRLCSESDSKRLVQSARSGAGNTPLKHRKIVTGSPKLSLYMDVLKKRQPLASLGSPNSPQPSLPIAKLYSPVANRTRKRSQEGTLTPCQSSTVCPKDQKDRELDLDNHSPKSFRPRLASSPLSGHPRKASSERSHVHKRVQAIIKQIKDQKGNSSHVNKNIPSVIQSGQNDTASRRVPVDLASSKAPFNNDLSLERQVQQYLLRNCCPAPDAVYSSMEELRHFLEAKLGSKRFYSVYNRLKEFGTEHIHLDSLCANDKISTCFPVLIQLLQMEHFSK